VIAAPDALLAAESVPHVAPLQPAPASAHATPWFPESFATVAVKLERPFTITLAAVCDKFTVIAGGVATIVIAAVPIFVPSATEVAVTVTLAGFGTAPGAA